MIFNVRSKQVEIKAAKRFRFMPRGDFSAPGHALMNWLGVMVFIKPASPAPEPDVWSEYVVHLKDGQEYHVKAINEYHAGSVVVYGNFDNKPLKLDGHTGKPLACDVKVHRENIASVHLKTNS